MRKPQKPCYMHVPGYCIRYGHTIPQYVQKTKSIIMVHARRSARHAYLEILRNPQRLHLSSLSLSVAGGADFLLVTDASCNNPLAATVFLRERCVRGTILNLLHNLRPGVNSQPLASGALARLFFVAPAGESPAGVPSCSTSLRFPSVDSFPFPFEELCSRQTLRADAMHFVVAQTGPARRKQRATYLRNAPRTHEWGQARSRGACCSRPCMRRPRRTTRCTESRELLAKV